MDPKTGLSSDHHRSWVALGLVTTVLFIIALAFGIWAYGSRQDFKNNVNQKITAAEAQTKQQTIASEDSKNDFANEKPLKAYDGPPQFGSVVVYYPKTWSAYVVDSSNSTNSTNPIDGYFQPNIVPDIGNSKNDFALRLQLLQQPYPQVLQSYQAEAKQGKVTITTYVPKMMAKVPGVTPGVRIDGLVQPGKEGSMVVMSIRADTLLLWTEAPQYEADFNNNILPNFSFSP